MKKSMRKRMWIGLLVIVGFIGVRFFMTHDFMLHNMAFRGESESWKGEYRIHGWWLFTEKDDRMKFDGRVDGVLTLTYTDEVEKPPVLDQFEIHYDLGPCGGGWLMEEDVVMDQIYRFDRMGTSVLNEATVMTVTIVMNESIETLELVMDE